MVMVEFKIRIHPIERQTYIPKLILENLGPEVTILPNMSAAALYPTGEDAQSAKPRPVERSRSTN